MRKRWMTACVAMAALAAACPAGAQEIDVESLLAVPEPAPVTAGQDLVAEVNEQVARWVASGRHDNVGGRLWGVANQLLWGHGHATAVMAQALPYLEPDLAARARQYLAAEVDDYLLNEEHLAREVAGSLGTREGIPDFGLTWQKNMAFRFEALYGLWAYAHHTGDWQRIERNWPAIKRIFAGCQIDQPRAAGGTTRGTSANLPAINSEIAGLIGLVRMARQVGDAATERVATAALRERLAKKLEQVDQAAELAIHMLGSGEPTTLYIADYQDLTPELARWLGARRPQKVAAQVAAITNRLRYWFLGDMDHVADWMASPPLPPVASNVEHEKHPGEESFQMSLFADPIFMLQAYALDQPADALRRQLPLAQSSRATPQSMDVFRLQHLLAILAAGGADAPVYAETLTRHAPLPGSPRAGENWPMYNHDPRLSGRTGDAVRLDRDNKLTLAWERQFADSAHVRAQPVIVDGVIYLGWMDGVFRALNLENGEDLWTVEVGRPICGSACVMGDTVIFATLDGRVLAYGRDGEPKWRVQAPGGVFASPIAADGVVYVGTLGRELLAIDAGTGDLRWRAELPGRVFGAAAVDAGVVVVQADDLRGYAFSAADGAPLWSCALPGETIRHGNPMIAGGTVLFTTTARGCDYASFRGRRETDPAFYRANPEAGTMAAVDLRTGAERFFPPQSSPYWGQFTPVMLDERLALKQMYEKLWTIDVVSGEVREVGERPFRRDEDVYGVVGGPYYYGAVADDLGLWDSRGAKSTTLVGDFWTHYVQEWRHVPDARNGHMFIPGPGDGNSGYATSPIPYGNRIVWQNCGTWLSCHEGREE